MAKNFMIKFIVFILLFSVAFTVSYAQQVSSFTATADSFYLKQDWQQASAAYQQAFAKGETQSALSLNRLGFAFLNLIIIMRLSKILNCHCKKNTRSMLSR
jgi:hypothetical protein